MLSGGSQSQGTGVTTHLQGSVLLLYSQRLASSAGERYVLPPMPIPELEKEPHCLLATEELREAGVAPRHRVLGSPGIVTMRAAPTRLCARTLGLQPLPLKQGHLQGNNAGSVAHVPAFGLSGLTHQALTHCPRGSERL